MIHYTMNFILRNLGNEPQNYINHLKRYCHKAFHGVKCDVDAPLVDRFNEYELFEIVGDIISYLVQEGHMI